MGRTQIEVVKNRIQRIAHGTKREEVTGRLRKLRCAS
jgi:hypothetical protein